MAAQPRRSLLGGGKDQDERTDHVADRHADPGAAIGGHGGDHRVDEKERDQDEQYGDDTKQGSHSYPHWLASRNLSNEAGDESVKALIDAVVGRYELARRWYRLKAKLRHESPAISFGRYVFSSEFGRAVLENWQSEYLQFTLYILGTVWLVQR